MGSLSVLLHAHLPYVRHAAPRDEERWLFEAITECYVPILRALDSLQRDGLAAHFTISISPTLGAMLTDDLLCERYLTYLKERIALATLIAGHPPNDASRQLAEFHRDFFAAVAKTFAEDWQCDLLAQFRTLRNRGAIELVATAATHALLALDSRTARNQIEAGLEFFSENFGGVPAGFWLPECAYSPGLEKLLAPHNIRWFGVEAHALERANPRAQRGPFAPVFTPSGPAAFAREPDASRQIWDARHGYPGDPSYREFHSDIGFQRSDIPLHERGKFTGLKLERITGRDGPKEVYQPQIAAETARAHAAHFVDRQIAQLKRVSISASESIIFVPFDAELFGHWWFEGPIFLEALVREASTRALPLATPTEFLARNPTQQIAQPAASSWGDGGFLDVWLDEKCAWLYPPLHSAQERMTELAGRFRDEVSAQQEQTLREMARELLLAQASDWPFLIRNGTASEYATTRVREHLRRFHQLARTLAQNETGTVESAYPSLFPKLNWRTFCAS